jgi:hypothetical protein
MGKRRNQKAQGMSQMTNEREQIQDKGTSFEPETDNGCSFPMESAVANHSEFGGNDISEKDKRTRVRNEDLNETRASDSDYNAGQSRSCEATERRSRRLSASVHVLPATREWQRDLQGVDHGDIIGENAEMAKENSIDLTGRVVSAVSNAMQGFMNEVSGTMRSLENVLQGLVAKAKSPSCENTPAEESRDSIVETRRRNREVHSTRTRMSRDSKGKADDSTSSSDGSDVEVEGYSSGISRFSLNMGRAARFRTARSHSVRLPAFTGKESWNVWINRFTAIADRQHWTNEQKLDELLPHLHGQAEDFVFSQLPRKTLGNFGALVNELNNRYRIVETTKTYAGQFSRRKQKPEELAEEYAAELKRLYDKAHPNRDTRTRREDLLRRFLDGLYDDRARFQVEYVKEPNDIDEAVYHVVNFMQTKTRSNVHESSQDRTFKKMTRRTTPWGVESDLEDDCELIEEDGFEAGEHAYRVPVKNYCAKKTQNTVKGGPATLKIKKEDMTEGEKSSENKCQDKEILQQIVDKINKIEDGMRRIQQNNMSTLLRKGGRSQMQTYQKRNLGNRHNLNCFSCGEQGHFSRECPYKPTTLGIDGLRSNLQKGEPNLQGKSVTNPTDCNYEALNEIGLAPRA